MPIMDSVFRVGFIRFREGVKFMGKFTSRATGPIFAQRIFRSYRFFQLHSKLWSDYVFKMALKNGHPDPRSKKWLLSLIFFSICEPKFDYIKAEELMDNFNDLDFIHELATATVICSSCNDRLVIDKKHPNVNYCHCANSPPAYKLSLEGWAPFVETPDLIVWRQEHKERPGLYMYKVYGNYDDISSMEFFKTQMDVEYRKEWDSSVINLDVVESDKDSNSELIYWEMRWPKMFANRDYCYTRRFYRNDENREMIIMNKAVKDPKVPEKKGNVRVSEYWSVMHIRALRGLEDDGVEFGLTYFDNPGLSLPNWLSNWAAMSGIPNFLTDVRKAAKNRRNL